MITPSKINAVTYITFTSLAMATTTLVLAYTFIGLWLYAAPVALLGLIWAAGIWRNRRGVNLGGLLIFVGIATYGVEAQAAALWLLVATVFSLIAWDLGEFRYRVAQVEAGDTGQQLLTAHLQRLGMAATVGLLAAGLALGLQINLTFGWAVFIGLMMAVSLSRFIRLARRG